MEGNSCSDRFLRMIKLIKMRYEKDETRIVNVGPVGKNCFLKNLKIHLGASIPELMLITWSYYYKKDLNLINATKFIDGVSGGQKVKR